jgi:hypothetical protein
MMTGTGEDSRAIFELLDTTLAGTTSDLLGIWITKSVAPSEGVAFNVKADVIAKALCWQTHLPADLHSANISLLEGETRLRISQQALPKAATRLEAFVRQWSTGLAFPVSTGQTLLQPEAELSDMLRELQEPSVSFGLGEQVSRGWRQAAQQFQALVDQCLQVVAHYAWIETYVGEQLLGQTAMSWTGNTETAWRVGLDSAQIALHQRALALTLASRITLIHMFILAARGAVTLSILLTIPVGPLLVLPAAWKFINQVVEEYREHRMRLMSARSTY